MIHILLFDRQHQLQTTTGLPLIDITVNNPKGWHAVVLDGKTPPPAIIKLVVCVLQWCKYKHLLPTQYETAEIIKTLGNFAYSS
jgi:hypothetical protein